MVSYECLNVWKVLRESLRWNEESRVSGDLVVAYTLVNYDN